MGTWNAAWLLLPTGTSSPALGDDNIREVKVEVGGRLNQEHVILNTATTGASVHRSGSAVVYLQDAEPTLRPDGVTVFDVNDHGRIWIDSNDSNHMYVYNGTDAEMQELTVGNIANDGDLDVTGALTVGTTVDIGGDVSIAAGATIATGGETSPDCDDGGITLVGGTGDKIMTFKDAARPHPFTTYAESDTQGIFYLDKGLNLYGFSSQYTGLKLTAYTALTYTTTVPDAAIMFNAAKTNGGTGKTTFAATENILSCSNNGDVKLLLKGNGTLYLDAGVLSFDTENDIELARALQLGMAKQPTLEPYRERLEELNIMENGCVSTQGFMALSLGTLHQIWNGLKAVAKRLDISEVELFEFAKGEV